MSEASPTPSRSGPDDRPIPADAWRRRGEGLEFDRVVFFTDAVFAIALTLLVVSIAVPVLTEPVNEPATLWNALGGKLPEFVSFFLAFIIIGRYWMAHHVFIGQLRAIDERFVGLNLVYLAFVAFLPFPTAQIGDYEKNPLSVVVFAMCLAVISGMETIQLSYAHNHGLLRRQPSREVYRYWCYASLAPVVLFVVSLPLAFVNTTLCLLSWMLIIPISRMLDRTVPKEQRKMMLGGELSSDDEA